MSKSFLNARRHHFDAHKVGQEIDSPLHRFAHGRFRSPQHWIRSEKTAKKQKKYKSVQQDKPKVKRDKVKEEVPYASKKVKSEAKSEK